MRMTVIGAILAVGLSITGCASNAGVDAHTSQRWQAQIVAIAASAHASDDATALTKLDVLEAEATQARRNGEISAERAAIIQQSIALVRADLESAAAAPGTIIGTDAPAPATPSNNGTKNGKGAKSGKKDQNNGDGNGN